MILPLHPKRWCPALGWPTGDKSGSARSFPTEASAKEYAGGVAKSGEKTTIVGTVVFQAATQEDADFFADAYR